MANPRGISRAATGIERDGTCAPPDAVARATGARDRGTGETMPSPEDDTTRRAFGRAGRPPRRRTSAGRLHAGTPATDSPIATATVPSLLGVTSLHVVAADPLWASALPPFIRARRFLEHLDILSAADWQQIIRRAHDADALARAKAIRHIGELLLLHPQTRAFGSLSSAAHDALASAGRQRIVPADLVAHVGRLTSVAACALALRERLPAAHAGALYGPFAWAAAARLGCDARSHLDDRGRDREPFSRGACTLACASGMSASRC